MSIRFRMIMVLGYWVLGNIHRYWIVLLLGGVVLFWHYVVLTPSTIQSDSSQHYPHVSERLFSSTLTWHNHLSGHHADMLLLIKHNHWHHYRAWDILSSLLCYALVLVLGTGIARGQYYWVLDIGWLSWYRSNPTPMAKLTGIDAAGSLQTRSPFCCPWTQITKA